MNNKLEAFITIILVVIIIGIITIPSLVAVNVKNEYTITVQDKERVVNKNSSYYLVFGKLDDGSIRVFRNSDIMLLGKFNSSDVQGMLEIGKSYKIETRGWRIPFLSMYENMSKVKELE